MAKRFSIEAVFKAVDKITGPVKRIQKRFSKFTRSSTRGLKKLDRGLGKVTRGLKSMAARSLIVGAVLGAVFANVVQAGAQFEQAITNVGAVSLKTRAEIAPLEKMARDLGRTTKFTATEAANAMEILAKAGFKNNEILKATPAILSAAAASGLEIAEVADVVSNALKGMGLEATKAGEVADVLALASSRTNSTIGSLGESLRNVASTARQLNIPINQVVAAVASLQDVGLDASVAGSAFNVMLTKMAAPSAGLQKKMDKLGLSFKDANGDMLPLNKVLEQLNRASKKVGGNFDQVAFLAELVGLRGQKAAANLSKLFESGKFQTLTKELDNAHGSAKKMADLRMDTLIGSWTLLQSSIDGVKMDIFAMTGGPIRAIIDATREWVDANGALVATKVGEFILDIIKNKDKILAWTKVIAIAAGVLGTVVVVVKSLIAVLTLLNLVMAANPVVLIGLAIAALVGVLISAVVFFKEWTEWVRNSSTAFKVLATSIALAGGPVTGFIALAALVMSHWGEVTGFLEDAFDIIVNKITIRVHQIKNLFLGFKDTVTLVVTSLKNDLLAMIDKIDAAQLKARNLIGLVSDKELSARLQVIQVASNLRDQEEDEQAAGNETRSLARERQIVSLESNLEEILAENNARRSQAEITIKDETGKAEVTKQSNASVLNLDTSGAF